MTYSIRYVSIDSNSAATADDGTCLSASDSNPDQGDCERVENCYWKPVEATSPRERKFTDEDAAAAQKTSKSYLTSLAFVLGPGRLCPGLHGFMVG